MMKIYISVSEWSVNINQRMGELCVQLCVIIVWNSDGDMLFIF